MLRREAGQSGGKKAKRTPTEIGQTVPTSPRQQAQKTAALSRVSSGRSVSRVYTAPSTPASTATTTSTATARSGPSRARVRAQRQAQRQERQRQRLVTSLIKEKPEKVERRLTRKTSSLAKTLERRRDTKLARPKVELGQRDTVKRNTIKVKPATAKQFFVGAKRGKAKVAKQLIKVPVRQPPKRERPKIEGPQERKVAAKLKKAAKKSEGGLAKKLDRGFGPTETITPRQTAIVAESEGLPGITYAQAIAPGESGHRPGVPNPDDATPSLFQITPSVQSAETQARFDKIASKRKGGYSNPIVAAKQAKVLAEGSSDAGVSNYVAFNPSASQGHLPGGQKAARRKLYGKPEPIPRPLKRKAKEVLGPKKAKAVVKAAKKPASPQEAKPKPGPWAGSQKAVLEIVPKVARAEGRGDKRTPTENASVGGAEDSDHLTTNRTAYAADIDPDPKVYNQIQRKLGLPVTQTGSQTIVKDGYRYQLIFGAEYDHGDHIHFGAEWVGSGVPDSAASGAVGGVVAAAGAATGAVPPSAVTSALAPADVLVRGKKGKRRKARRMEGRDKARLIRELIANTPVPVERVAATSSEFSEQARQPVTLGIE